MPVPLPGPNVVMYILIGGQEFRRVYSSDGLTAVDQIVDATIQATPEYITYHAAEEAIPVAQDDTSYLTGDVPDPGLTVTDDGV